jgi:DNA-binding protein HU-beta
MTKAELITVIADEAGISKAAAAKALDAYTGAVTKELKKSGKLGLVGFGTFSVIKRKAREGRNPQTGKTIKIAAKKVVKFKAGKKLADKVK